VWNLIEQLLHKIVMLPPSGLRRTVLFTGESLSWKSASISGERPYKKPHNNLRSQDFQRLRQNSWQNFSKQHNISKLIAYPLTRCFNLIILITNSLQLFQLLQPITSIQLLQSDYQLPPNDHQLTTNC
jgi:hypothetical protein